MVPIPWHKAALLRRRQCQPANAQSRWYVAGGFPASTTCRVGLRLQFLLQLRHLCSARLPTHFQHLRVPCLPQLYAPVEEPK
jgi:hypothetical protein